MNCLIHIAAMCIFDPSTVYVAAQMDFAPAMERHGAGDTLRFEGAWCGEKWCRGPLATLRIGVRMELTETLTLDYGYQHKSFINDSDDKGFNAPFAGLTWRPFK